VAERIEEDRAGRGDHRAGDRSMHPRAAGVSASVTNAATRARGGSGSAGASKSVRSTSVVVTSTGTRRGGPGETITMPSGAPSAAVA
jgi:hypothetical protein